MPTEWMNNANLAEWPSIAQSYTEMGPKITRAHVAEAGTGIDHEGTENLTWIRFCTREAYILAHFYASSECTEPADVFAEYQDKGTRGLLSVRRLMAEVCEGALVTVKEFGFIAHKDLWAVPCLRLCSSRSGYIDVWPILLGKGGTIRLTAVSRRWGRCLGCWVFQTVQRHA